MPEDNVSLTRIQAAIMFVLLVIAIGIPLIMLLVQTSVMAERQQVSLAHMDKIETHLILVERRLDGFSTINNQMEVRVTRLEALLCARDRTLCKGG